MQTVKKQFDWLERKLGKGPYFNGKGFSLVDIAYAPLFMRTNLLKLEDQLYPTARFPKTAEWADKLLSIPVLSKSVVSDFDTLFISHVKNKAPYVAAQFGL